MLKNPDPVRLSAVVVSLLAMLVLVGCPAPPADDPAVEEPVIEEPVVEEPAIEEPAIEEPAVETPAVETPAIETPAIETPAIETPAVETPAVETPAVETPAVETPAIEVPAIEPPAVETPAVETPAIEVPAIEPPAVETPAAVEPLAKAELLVELDDAYSTPDGMCLLPNGDVLLAVPNVNSWLAAVAEDAENAKQDPPPMILKITKDNKVEKYYDPPRHPVTGTAFPFGMCVDPEGKNLYITDLQWFSNTEEPGNNSRVLRIPLDEDCNPAGEPVVLIEGMVVANAVIIRDGYLYVTDTSMVPKTNPDDPQISGILRVKLDAEGTKLTLPLLEDPHLVATVKTFNPKVAFGADGLTFDSKGNLYCGNYADGTLHKIEFDDEGNSKVEEAPIWAQDPTMKCCDGIFCDLRNDKIYVADSLANAVQIVSPDGSVQCLAVDEDNDGSGGRLDQPCEVLIRGNEVIVSNMDFPTPGGVNKIWDKPYTISVIKLPAE